MAVILSQPKYVNFYHIEPKLSQASQANIIAVGTWLIIKLPMCDMAFFEPMHRDDIHNITH